MQFSMRAIAASCSTALMIGLTGPANAIDFKKILPLSVQGVSLSVPISGAFQANTEGDVLNIQVSTVGSLKEIQDRALEIARRLPVPTGNCDRKGLDKPNVVVNRIDHANITADGKSAVIELVGHVEVWTCVDLFGTDAKTKIASDSIRLTAALELAVAANGRQVSLKLSRGAELKTGHQLTAEAARLFVGDLNAKLSSALAGLLDAHIARATLPDLPGAEYAITDAAFAADGPVLTAKANGRGKLTSDSFTRLLEFLAK